MAISGNAAAQQRISLDKPQFDRGLNIMQSFKNRHSERSWADRTVSKRDLSDLLWAADGVNRPNGKRTAPSALGKNDVDVYVFTAEGAYLYLPDKYEIELVAPGDHRALVVAGQPNITQMPPLALVYTSTPSRFGVSDAKAAEAMGYVDIGMVSENVGLFCAGNGLVNVPRWSMDRDALRKLLKLSDDVILGMNDLIGYPAQ